MKNQSDLRGHCLEVIAAAALLGLGATASLAQQEGGELQTDPESAAEEQQPGAAEQESTQTASAEEGTEGLDQLAQEHEDLSTFVEAVKAAGMAESLMEEGTSYTLFAPTNDAFEQMSGLGTEELLQPENRDQLISLLRAHIVADDVDQELARNLPEAQTIDGGTVEISMPEEGEMMVGDARVVESDIQMGNLRVYAIDQVLSEGTAVATADEPSAEDEAESEQEATDEISPEPELSPEPEISPEPETSPDISPQ
ncbi:MAG TPA: fasciclin domain-containing protein [Gammaproteobacteria bacterium]